jgi:hypothetical protein
LACESNPAPYMGPTTLRYKNGTYRGSMKAVKSTCIRNRNVAIRKVRAGTDPVIGRDTTNSRGKYAVSKRRGNGRFYAKVGPKGNCVSEKLKSIRL